jgi:hypothetical protein
VSYQISEHCEVFRVSHETLLDVNNIVAEILGRLDQVALPKASSGQDLHIRVLKLVHNYSDGSSHYHTVYSASKQHSHTRPRLWTHYRGRVVNFNVSKGQGWAGNAQYRFRDNVNSSSRC